MVSSTLTLVFTGLFLSIFCCTISAYFVGTVIQMREQIRDAKTALEVKVDEFGEMTAKASEANVSMAIMLADMGEKVQIIDERIGMLSGSPTGGPTWQSQATKTKL